MPDPVDLDLGELTRNRQELASVTAEQTALRVELAASSSTLDQLRRTVTDTAALADAERAVVELETRRAALHDRAFGADRWDQRPRRPACVVGRDIGDSVRTLDANVPIAMLPVRIETRFAPDQTALDIRIYPDQVHLDAHEPEFTDDERQAAEWYWQQRWAALDDGDVADQAWQTVAGRFRPGRARYLVETLHPTNTDAAPDGSPEFPDTPRRATSWTRAVEATALPGALGRRRLPGRRGGVPGVVGTAGARPARRRTDARPRRSAAGTTGRLQAAARSRTPCAGRSTSTPHATPAWR